MFFIIPRSLWSRQSQWSIFILRNCPQVVTLLLLLLVTLDIIKRILSWWINRRLIEVSWGLYSSELIIRENRQRKSSNNQPHKVVSSPVWEMASMISLTMMDSFAQEHKSMEMTLSLERSESLKMTITRLVIGRRSLPCKMPLCLWDITRMVSSIKLCSLKMILAIYSSRSNPDPLKFHKSETSLPRDMDRKEQLVWHIDRKISHSPEKESLLILLWIPMLFPLVWLLVTWLNVFFRKNQHLMEQLVTLLHSVDNKSLTFLPNYMPWATKGTETRDCTMDSPVKS